MKFGKDISILNKILAGVVLVSLFLAAQLAGVFYSNNANVKRVTNINEIQKASRTIDNLKELVAASIRIIGQLPEKSEDIRESRLVTRQNFQHLRRLLGNLERLLNSLEIKTQLVLNVNQSVQNLQETAQDLYRQALLEELSAESEETTQILIRQFGGETTDFLTKLNLELNQKSNELFLELYQARHRPLKIGGWLTLALLVATLLGGLLFFRNLAGSITNLKEATEQIAAGNLTYAAPVLSKDELGELTQSFNQMGKTLFESTVSREYVKSILESLPDSLMLTNSQGVVLGTNEAASSLLGLAQDDIVGRDIKSFFTDDFQLADPQKLAHEDSYSFECDFLLSSGKTIPVFCSVALAENNRKDGGTAIYIMKNISDLRDLQEELKKRNDELSSANKELEAFSYSVSHDLRAPLRSLDGFSSSLLKMYADKLDERGKDYLGRIRESSVKMGRLIDDLLNLSRLGRAELVKKKTNLSAIVQEVAKDLEEADPGREVDWRIQSEVWALADSQLMRVVFQNLLSNSWKFTSKHKSARIEFCVKEENGKKVYIVKDNGAGFDMQYANKLFVPFQRLHAGTDFPGTGIGLALVNRVIHRHGGRVWAQGEVERGASIKFTLED